MFRSVILGLALFAGFAGPPARSFGAEAGPAQQMRDAPVDQAVFKPVDAKVYDALLKELIKRGPLSRGGNRIVMHSLTENEPTYVSESYFHEYYLGDIKSDVDAEAEIRQRSRRSIPLTLYRPVTDDIVVSDLSRHWRTLTRARFRELYPDAVGYVEVYLPGYSESRKRSLVRFLMGPASVRSIGTAALEDDGKEWRVKTLTILSFLH